jgi:hypothetical protein
VPFELRSPRPDHSAAVVGAAVIPATWRKPFLKLDREIDNSASDSSGHPRGGDSGEAAAATVIDCAGREKDRDFDLPQQRLLDSFQGGSGPVWNHFKTGFFLLPPAAVFSIDGSASPKGLLV